MQNFLFGGFYWMEKKCLLLSTFSTFQAPLTLLTNSAMWGIVMVEQNIEGPFMDWSYNLMSWKLYAAYTVYWQWFLKSIVRYNFVSAFAATRLRWWQFIMSIAQLTIITMSNYHHDEYCLPMWWVLLMLIFWLIDKFWCSPSLKLNKSISFNSI